jgi:hypothetical protein
VERVVQRAALLVELLVVRQVEPRVARLEEPRVALLEVLQVQVQVPLVQVLLEQRQLEELQELSVRWLELLPG